MSLKVIFVESTALNLNQKLTRKGIAEEQIGTPSVNYNLPPNESQTRLNE